jgi:hypothetical protein
MPQPLVEGEDYYWEKGLVVLTEGHHLRRGYCCGAGCRHCPYDYDAVPEPKRAALLLKQQSKDQTPDA